MTVDPSDLIAQAETGEQAKAAGADRRLPRARRARPQEWDAEAFEGSVAERAVARTAEEWSAAAGELPVELVRLRNEREITRADLVTRLADSLGVSGAREKVASYYHRLERGLLPAEGVSSRVWEALAQLLDTSAEALRRAGAAATRPPPTEEAASAYARTAPPPPPEYATTNHRRRNRELRTRSARRNPTRWTGCSPAASLAPSVDEIEQQAESVLAERAGMDLERRASCRSRSTHRRLVITAC